MILSRNELVEAGAMLVKKIGCVFCLNVDAKTCFELLIEVEEVRVDVAEQGLFGVKAKSDG